MNEPLTDHGFQRYQLTKANETYKKQQLQLTSEKQEESKEIDLDTASATDIVQISSLLQSESVGSFAVDNDFSVLTSSGRDQKTKLPLTHNWTLVKQVENASFECRLKKEAHLK